LVVPRVVWVAVLVLCLGLLVSACEASPRPGSWSIRFATDALRERAVLVQAQIERGGCASGIVVYSDEIAPGERASMPPILEPGVYGFSARARDATCIHFAGDCTERRLPSDDAAIVVVVDSRPAEPACAEGVACLAGRCAGVDAGPSDGGGMDVRPPPDGGRDGGPIDGGPIDTGPPDTGPPDTGPPDTGPPDAGPDLTTGLVAFWECVDDIGDGRSDDATGSGHDGTCSASSCPSRVMSPSRSGSVCSFDGGDHLVVANDPDFNRDRFTISLWLNARMSDAAFISKPVGTGSSNSWQLELRDPVVTFTTGVASSRQFLDSSVDLTIGRWYHVAATYDGGTKRLYVDGALVGTQDAPVGFDAHDVIIGADDNDGSIVLHYDGLLDDIRIYDRQLDAIQIAALAEL
jgi:hypothetical protein